MADVSELSMGSLQVVLDSLHDGLYLVDRDRVITYWNRAAEAISGFSAEEVVGRSCADSVLTHVDCEGNCLCTGSCPLAAAIEDDKPREAEVYMHHKDGHRVPVSVRASPLLSDTGETIGGVELFTDISNRLGSELRAKELEKMALLDALTSMANRAFIDRQIGSMLAEKRRLGLSFGMLFFDIDGFKEVNDTHGHEAGDRVLAAVARTLTSNSRPFDVFGRWGGDEFIGLIRNVDRAELEIVAERVRKLIEQSYVTYRDTALRVTVSMGATIVVDDDTPATLIERLDVGLYRSKTAGKNCLTIS